MNLTTANQCATIISVVLCLFSVAITLLPRTMDQTGCDFIELQNAFREATGEKSREQKVSNRLMSESHPADQSTERPTLREGEEYGHRELWDAAGRRNWPPAGPNARATSGLHRGDLLTELEHWQGELLRVCEVTTRTETLQETRTHLYSQLPFTRIDAANGVENLFRGPDSGTAPEVRVIVWAATSSQNALCAAAAEASVLREELERRAEISGRSPMSFTAVGRIWEIPDQVRPDLTVETRTQISTERL